MKVATLSFYLAFSSLVIAQDFRITKLFDTNLFQLSNNEIVSLYGLDIPSKSDSNLFHRKVAIEILRREREALLNKVFRFEFLEAKDSVVEVKAYRTYALGEENLSNWFLSKGYAILKPENTDQQELIHYQRRAQSYGYGIWNSDKTVSEKDLIIEMENVESGGSKYKHPYRGFLVIGVVFAGLAWDYFASASDIQSTVDIIKEIDKTADVGSLESSVTRKRVIGIACFAASLTSVIFSFKSVEVKTDLTNLSLSYRF